MPDANGRKTVTVCGSLHLDIVVNTTELPRIDQTVVGSEMRYVCGGKGGNQAVAASLFANSSAMIGCVGEDEFGKILTANLSKYGVNCSGLQKTDCASGMSVAIVDAQGDYAAVIVSSSNLRLDSDAIVLPSNSGILLLQNEIPEPINLELAARAREQGIPVMLNAAPFRTIPMELEKNIDYLVLNQVEAEQYFNAVVSSPEDVSELLGNCHSPIEHIVITLGEKGLVYRSADRRVLTKNAYTVKVVSSHGAGDMFCGALAAKLVSAYGMSDALDFAMAAAACHVALSVDERSDMSIELVSGFLGKL